MIADKDWDVSMPATTDDVSMKCPGFHSLETFEGESFGDVTILSYQRYKFRLYRIASSITQDIYLRKEATVRQIVDEIKTINQRLLQWERHIPPELQLKSFKGNRTDSPNTAITKTFQRQALVLQLSYDNIQLVLHRPLLTMNRVPRNPAIQLDFQGPGRDIPRMEKGSTDTVNDMIKTSKYRCWESAVRTSRIGEHPDVLAAVQNTHGAAYAGIQCFTAGVVLGIFALSDPLSSQAHQAKQAISSLIKLPKMHGYRTTVSDQCGTILEELVRLTLAEEMKSLLADAHVAGGNHRPHGSENNREVVESLAWHDPLLSSSHTDCVNRGTQQSPFWTQPEQDDPSESSSASQLELPPYLVYGNYSDALSCLQDGMTCLG